MAEPLLELRAVNVVYANGFPALNRLSLRVSRGEFVLLHGATGCGKSTVLRLLAGLVRPSAGEVIVAGDRVDLFNAIQRRWLRRSMGLMMQESRLLDDRSVHENVMLPALAAEESFSEARRRALLALEKCGIGDLATLSPAALSAGQRQLVLLARAVVNRPVVILADEPVAHLDQENARTLLELLAAFVRAGVTVVAASHEHIAPVRVPFREVLLTTQSAQEADREYLSAKHALDAAFEEKREDWLKRICSRAAGL